MACFKHRSSNVALIWKIQMFIPKGKKNPYRQHCFGVIRSNNYGASATRHDAAFYPGGVHSPTAVAAASLEEGGDRVFIVCVFVFPFPSLYEIITSLYIAVQSKIELICIEIERFCACLHSQPFFLFVHRQYHEKHRILARKIQHYRVHLRKRESRKQLLFVAVLF